MVTNDASVFHPSAVPGIAGSPWEWEVTGAKGAPTPMIFTARTNNPGAAHLEHAEGGSNVEGDRR